MICPVSVDVTDVKQIPLEFMRSPKPPASSPDKKAIAAAIEKGTLVPGARIVQNISLVRK